MKIYNKILIGSWLLTSLFLWYGFTFWESKDIPQERNAQDRVNYEEAERIAQRYLEKNKDDDLWENNSPRLWEATPLFMEKEIPSYVEYSVSCERNSQCWFIVVNIDGDDVDIPVASPSDTPPSQRLLDKSWAEKQELQFYYFGPFDIYSKNQITGQINAIDPHSDPTEEMYIFPSMDEEEKASIQLWIINQTNQLPKRFEQQLNFWNEYKKTEKFQKITEKIYEYNILSWPWYEIVDDWKYVKWEDSDDCNSIIPCYKQYAYKYSFPWDPSCLTGCSPVAATMIFAYHDKENNFPDLFSSPFSDIVAPMINNRDDTPWENLFVQTPRKTINSLRYYMNTFCNASSTETPLPGVTYDYNMSEWIQYAIDKWYENSTSWWIDSEDEEYGHLVYPVIKSEIHNGRPLLVNIKSIYFDFDVYEFDTSWHTVVWFAYNMNTDDEEIQEIRINAGWGNEEHANLTINTFNITNIDISPANAVSLFTWTTSVVWYKIAE